MPLNKETTIYNAVDYLRLSKEDGDKTESDSISNQRDLITNCKVNTRNPPLFGKNR